MSDILIRGLDEGTVSRLDALAENQGTSRNSVIRAILDEATRTSIAMNEQDALAVLGLMADLGDQDVMADAWR